MYPNDTQIRELLTDHLIMMAPGFTLMHYHSTPMHNHIRLTVCAQEGLNRLMFEAKAFEGVILTGRLDYIGTAPCTNAHTGLDNRVKLLMDAFPHAHIQHIDNEEDGDDALFGYVAYSATFMPLAWAPVPLDAEGSPTPELHAFITTDFPEGLDDWVGYLGEEERIASRR